jgi:hypothetical protein
VLEALITSSLLKPIFAASSLVGGLLLAGGVASSGFSRGPPFSL